MSYVDPKIRELFENLPIEVKNQILERGVNLYTADDLNQIIFKINNEG